MNKNKEKLEVLFDKVLDKSYQLRKKNLLNFDGQEFWQHIKKILEPLDKYKASKWKTISKTKTHKIMLLSEYTIDGYENKIINEKNHFIIQQVRIPLKEIPNIKKIIQIALNIGQYKAFNNKSQFDNISEFILKEDIIELSKYLTDNIIQKIDNYLLNL